MHRSKQPVRMILATAAVAAVGSVSVGLSTAHADDTPSASASSGTTSAGSDCQNLKPTVTKDPDGGRTYEFHTPDGSVITSEQPPTGFDPATAPPGQLKKYGFPAQPQDAAKRADWHEAMAAYKGTDTPGLCWNSAPAPPHQPEVSATNTSGIWSGYVASAASGNSYVVVSGKWTQPSRLATSCANSRQSTWVGLGGYRTGNLLQDGTAYATTGSPYAWFEYLGAAGTVSEQKMSLGVSPGDQLYADTTYSGGTASFFVENITTGMTAYASKDGMAGDYDGGDAEWIEERPSVNKVPVPLQNFGSVSFTAAQVEGASGATHYLADTYQQTNLTMVNNGYDLATVGAITGGNGGAFGDTFQRCS